MLEGSRVRLQNTAPRTSPRPVDNDGSLFGIARVALVHAEIDRSVVVLERPVRLQMMNASSAYLLRVLKLNSGGSSCWGSSSSFGGLIGSAYMHACTGSNYRYQTPEVVAD